ncbi:MAG: aminopeptidase [Desulfosudaceae bacterium]
MLTAKQMERYAEVLFWGMARARKNKFKKNDLVAVRYHLPALPLAEILQEKLLQAGYNPVLRALMTPVMEKNFYRLANDDQLVFQAPGEKNLIKSLHGSISLLAPESLTHLRGIDSARIGRTATARKPLRDILERRENEGEFGWTLGMYPTAELARQAGLNQKEYTSQLVRACFLNRVDPVAQWQEIFQQARAIKQWLNRMKIKTLHIESQNIDLAITPGESRRWVGISGHNIPSFEIFLSPDWRGTRGVYLADMPSYRDGNLVKNLKIEFADGRAGKITAEQGQAFARKLLAMDEGADKLGEFSLTDRRFSKINRFMANTLFDENFGGRQGNCHIALGASYSDTYSGNPADLTKTKKRQLGFNDSALHWDIINTQKKRVTAVLTSGKRRVIYENGQFAL